MLHYSTSSTRPELNVCPLLFAFDTLSQSRTRAVVPRTHTLNRPKETVLIQDRKFLEFLLSSLAPSPKLTFSDFLSSSSTYVLCGIYLVALTILHIHVCLLFLLPAIKSSNKNVEARRKQENG